jgi:hypothetical protein
MKNDLTFTQKDFLNACDLINQIKQDSFGMWLDAAEQENSFDRTFTSKQKAKQVLYDLIGFDIYGYNIYSL